MDYTQVKDPVTLKAMAYDEIAKKEQAEINLNAINQQLRKVLEAPAPSLPKSGDAAAEETPPPAPTE
jgi:hypothetical protein